MIPSGGWLQGSEFITCADVFLSSVQSSLLMYTATFALTSLHLLEFVAFKENCCSDGLFLEKLQLAVAHCLVSATLFSSRP